MTITTKNKITPTRNTASLWASTNIIPILGEICIETDTSKIKIGDGVTAYNSLAYFSTSTNIAPTMGVEVTVANKNKHYDMMKNPLGETVFVEQTYYYNVSSYSATKGYGIGVNALYNNLGQLCNAFGFESLYLNTGAMSDGFGYQALKNNTGASCSGFGYQALYNNTGAGCVAIGQYAMSNNTGTGCSAIGQYAMMTNTGSYCVGIGTYALDGNTSNNNNAVGRYALYKNIGSSCNAFGNQALYTNKGNSCVAMGESAMYSNVGSYCIGIGSSALQFNQSSNNIAIGFAANMGFVPDTANNKTFDYTAINPTTNRITISLHGLGSNDQYIYVRYVGSTGSIPGGLMASGTYLAKIIDVNTIEIQYDITSQGTGTHTITPQLSFYNTICIGNETASSKNNQVVLGGTSISETVLRGLVLCPTAKIGTTENYAEFEADGTLRFNGTATVYKDLQYSISSGKVAANNAPTWSTFNSGFSEYAFAVNDYIDLGSQELPHDYKEGSSLEVHLHWSPNGTEATTKYVKWEIFYCYAIMGANYTGYSSLAVEEGFTSSATNKHIYTSVLSITDANLKIGTQIKIRLKRVASTGTAPTGNPFALQVGIHYEADTLGSRTTSAK